MTERVCETQPHCACLTPSGDGLDGYSCECFGDSRGNCVNCGVPLVSVRTYQQPARRLARALRLWGGSCGLLDAVGVNRGTPDQPLFVQGPGGALLIQPPEGDWSEAARARHEKDAAKLRAEMGGAP